MGWITTSSLPTLVVDLLLAGDVAVVVGVDHQMYGDCLSIQTHPAIAPTPTGTRIGASPEVAGAWFVIEYEPGVFDATAGFDTIQNLVTSM